MRLALALLLVACTPGIAPSVERADHELAVRYRSATRSAAEPNVEYLGDGCYIVGDRLGHGLGYGCVTDPRSPTGRQCIRTPHDGIVTYVQECRRRPDLISGSDCVEKFAPERCIERFRRHDRRHGRGTCTVRIRAQGSSVADLPLALDTAAMLELRDALGKRWSGVGPLVFAADSCGFPVRSTKKHTPSQALDELIARALAGHSRGCGLTTVHVTGFEACVF